MGSHWRSSSKTSWNYNSSLPQQLKYFGNTLVKTAPLLMCALSVLFAYKVGLFNIGAAGQYVAGACACALCALAWSMPLACVPAGGGRLPARLLGVRRPALLKAYCNVNEVISGIMLNWIGLYTTNMILTNVKEDTSPYTLQMKSFGKQAILPSLGFDKLLGDNKYITMAIPLSVLLAIVVWIVMEKTMFGYELKATGLTRMPRNTAVCRKSATRSSRSSSQVRWPASAASLLYQTGYEQWQCTASSVPAMGFNGIAATFLGGLNPIGTIFASFFIQHITAGGAYVDKSIYCSQVSDLISSLIIYLCAFVLFLKTAMNRWIFLHEERKAKKAAKTEKGGEA